MFSMFEWTSEFAINIGSIDAQHQSLFAIGRELYAAMTAGRGKSAILKTLDRLLQYTTMHFAHEERLMKLHKYPDFARHRAEHDALVIQVLAFRAEFEGSRAYIAVRMLQFIEDWLQMHIKVSDAAYAPCLKAKKAA